VNLSELEAVARSLFDPVERRGDAVITDATHDSRLVGPGSLFIARRGARTDGHAYLDEALSRGASALAVEHDVAVEAPLLRVPRTDPLCGPWAALVQGRPSEAMAVVGVTGTNGKTTLTYLLQAACRAHGLRTGLVGTIETQVGDHCSPSVLTTPQATDLQRTLAEMRGQGTDVVAMEVSSHGLDQHRVDGTRFDLAVFTNLEAEHLDYHGTLEDYYATKASLFTSRFTDRALICVDDAWGRRLASQIELSSLTFGRAGTGAPVEYRVDERGLEGIEVVVESPAGRVKLSSRLIGAINAANVVAAYLAAVEVGVDPDQAAAGIAACPRPPGRFQLLHAGQPFLVVVDYAHTPCSLASMLETSRALSDWQGRVAVVVGARGGRDRSKRQDTGRVAASADLAVLTSDSPGPEPPLAILEQLALGTLGVTGAQVVQEVDRAAAIERALAWARPGDVVLIVGRGHERHLHWGDRVVSFDDRQVALDALHRFGWPAERPAGSAMVSVSRDGTRPGQRGIRSGAETPTEPARGEVTGPFGPRHSGGDGPG
jgi:UDP-N-acetylmuramoyl-L-alanyl-D-glutamate--2,6-diaminopimelate ligase